RRPRMRLEPLRRDLLAAALADAVRSRVDSGERGVDLAQDLLGVLSERVVDLAVQGRRRGLAEMVVARRRDLLDLLVERARMVVAKVCDRALHALALLEELRAEMLGVDAHERLSFLPRSIVEAEARRRSISPGPTPVSSTI